MAANVHGNKIYYDIDTSNKSFLEISDFLKSQNIRNNKIMLQLNNPELAGVDPWSKDLSVKQQTMIAKEVSENYWYYIREVYRIVSTGEKIPYLLNRANFSASFLMLNNVNTYLIMPRQHGKTITAIAWYVWLMMFSSYNSSISTTHKDYDGIVNNIARISNSFKESFPDYLLGVLDPKEDKKNEKRVYLDKTKNSINAVTPNASRNSAEKAGRGATSPLMYLDEMAFIPNIQPMFNAMIPSMTAAIVAAKKQSQHYGVLITTTPGSLNNRDSIFAKNIMDSAAKWDEKVLDGWLSADDGEAFIHEWVTNNSMNDYVHIQYSYKQLGKDESWLKAQTRSLNGDVEAVKREILLQWTTSANNSPFSEETIDEIQTFVKDKDDYYGRIGLLNNTYYADLIEYPSNMMNKNYIMGVDVSAGLNRDSSAITVIDPLSMKPVMIFNNNNITVPDLGRIITELVNNYFKSAIVQIERNNAGITLIQSLMETPIINNMYYINRSNEGKQKINHNVLTPDSYMKKSSENRIYGVNTTASTRNIMIDEILFMLVQEHKEVFNNSQMFSEIATLERKKNGKIEHADDAHDDQLFSLFIALYPMLYDQKYGKFLKNVNNTVIHDDGTMDYGTSSGKFTDKEKSSLKNWSKFARQELFNSR